MADECPFCGESKYVRKHGTFHFEVPNDGSNPNAREFVLDVPNAEWEECGACGEVVIPPELDAEIEKWQYRREGLLTPEEIKSIRKRFGLTQKEIAQKLGVGEKSFTRWENGLSMQTKAIDNLIRLFENGPEKFTQISNECQAYGHIKALVAPYLELIENKEDMNVNARAAHGGGRRGRTIDAISRYLKNLQKNGIN